MPKLSSLTVFPIKSLPGVSLSDCAVTAAGSLANDRRFALITTDGKFVNGKRYPSLLTVTAQFSEDLLSCTLSIPTGAGVSFHLVKEKAAAANWFSEFLGTTCTLIENETEGFPDDTIARGPTVVSLASIALCSEWFPELNADEVARRFRANLILEGIGAFEEDGFCQPDSAFVIGTITMYGKYPCKRCSVPTRDSRTGAVQPDFMKRFTNGRRIKTKSSSGNNPGTDYLFAINTVIPPTEAGKRFYAGDTVTPPYSF